MECMAWRAGMQALISRLDMKSSPIPIPGVNLQVQAKASSSF
jgi:hypothetical protein